MPNDRLASGLLQDDDRNLSRWLSSRPGARRLVDLNCKELRKTNMDLTDLKIGGKYNFKNQPERLVYMGAKRYHGGDHTWHQFARVETPDVCWAEVLKSDLRMFEETKG